MLPPPRPVKISRKKEGRQWRPHRFHVSRPPLPGCWIRYCVVSQFQKVGLVLTPQVPCLEGVGRYPWTYPPSYLDIPLLHTTRHTHQRYPREQTDNCENITFPQLRLRAVTNCKFEWPKHLHEGSSSVLRRACKILVKHFLKYSAHLPDIILFAPPLANPSGALPFVKHNTCRETVLLHTT